MGETLRLLTSTVWSIRVTTPGPATGTTPYHSIRRALLKD